MANYTVDVKFENYSIAYAFDNVDAAAWDDDLDGNLDTRGAGDRSNPVSDSDALRTFAINASVLPNGGKARIESGNFFPLNNITQGNRGYSNQPDPISIFVPGGLDIKCLPVDLGSSKMSWSLATDRGDPGLHYNLHSGKIHLYGIVFDIANMQQKDMIGVSLGGGNVGDVKYLAQYIRDVRYIDVSTTGGLNWETEEGFSSIERWMRGGRFCGLEVRGGTIWGISKEHAFYNSSMRGPNRYSCVEAYWCDRTFGQNANRNGEGDGTFGRGSLKFQNCRIRDILGQAQGGGYVFAMKGRNRAHGVIENNYSALGCNPNISSIRQGRVPAGFIEVGVRASKDNPERVVWRTMTIRRNTFVAGTLFDGDGKREIAQIHAGADEVILEDNAWWSFNDQFQLNMVTHDVVNDGATGEQKIFRFGVGSRNRGQGRINIGVGAVPDSNPNGTGWRSEFTYRFDDWDDFRANFRFDRHGDIFYLFDEGEGVDDDEIVFIPESRAGIPDDEDLSYETRIDHIPDFPSLDNTEIYYHPTLTPTEEGRAPFPDAELEDVGPTVDDRDVPGEFTYEIDGGDIVFTAPEVAELGFPFSEEDDGDLYSVETILQFLPVSDLDVPVQDRITVGTDLENPPPPPPPPLPPAEDQSGDGLEKDLNYLLGLLPPGQLKDAAGQGTTKWKVTKVIDEIIRNAVIYLRDALENEGDPRRARVLLDDWSTMMGLPPECVRGHFGSEDVKRGMVYGLLRLQGAGGLQPGILLGLLELFGFPGLTITAPRYKKFRAGDGEAGDPIRGIGYDCTFQINAPGELASVSRFQSGGSRSGDPLSSGGNAALRCLVDKFKPSHRLVRIVYGNCEWYPLEQWNSGDSWPNDC